MWSGCMWVTITRSTGRPSQLVGEHLLPGRARGVVGDAAVDDGPALAAVDAVAQQPQVDVVQRERQRHAQPAHAGRDLAACSPGAGSGVAEGVVQFGFVRVGMRVQRRAATLTFTSTSICAMPAAACAAEPQPTFTIAELAAGVRHHAARDPLLRGRGPARAARAGRNRVYSQRDRTRLKLTLRGKRLGLSCRRSSSWSTCTTRRPTPRQQLNAFLAVLGEHRAPARAAARRHRDHAGRDRASTRQRCRALLGEDPRTRQGARPKETTA